MPGGEGKAGFFPGRASIDGYGNGGFRFAQMSHRGSILCLPSGIGAWDVESAADIKPDTFDRIFEVAGQIGFVLLGTGVTQVFPSLDVRQRFADAGIGLEPMTTGAACHTYNVLLGEGRAVAAALIAVA